MTASKPAALAATATNPAHDPSFTAPARRNFFARLGALKVDYYDELCPLLASLDRPRPSAMNADRRARMLTWLGSEKGRKAIEQWRAERAEQATTTQDAPLIHSADPAVIFVGDADVAIVRNRDGFSVHKYFGDHLIPKPIAWFASEADALAWAAR